MATGPKPSFLIRALLALVLPLLLLAIWQFLSAQGVFRPTLLPSPLIIAQTSWDLLKTGELEKNLAISLLRVLQGFAVGAGLGLVLGLALGLSERLRQLSRLLTEFLRPIPTIAWVPILILWMGIDEGSKITVIAIGSFWPVFLNTLEGVRQTDPHYLEVARVLEKPRWVLVSRVMLPSALPSIFTGLRVGMGIAWASVVGAELIAASSGIGYMILYAREVSQPDVVLCGVAAIGLTGLVIDSLLRWLERALLKWNRTDER
jgi:sulfonate transport system permease protein